MLKQKLIFITAIIILVFFIYGCNNQNNNQYEGKIILEEQGVLLLAGPLRKQRESLTDTICFQARTGKLIIATMDTLFIKFRLILENIL